MGKAKRNWQEHLEAAQASGMAMRVDLPTPPLVLVTVNLIIESAQTGVPNQQCGCSSAARYSQHPPKGRKVLARSQMRRHHCRATSTSTRPATPGRPSAVPSPLIATSKSLEGTAAPQIPARFTVIFGKLPVSVSDGSITARTWPAMSVASMPGSTGEARPCAWSGAHDRASLSGPARSSPACPGT